MSQDPNLTFGVQLEVICVTDTAGFPDCRVGAHGLSPAGTAIFDGLRDAGLAVTGDESDDEALRPVPEYSLWQVESDCCALSRAEHDACPAHCIGETVELSSRKFAFDRDDWRAEIHAVLDVLARLEARGARFLTNHTTGLHVHVGLAGPEGEIPLRTAKTVMQLATAFERVCDQLHRRDRIAYPVRFDTDWYHTPLSWFHARNGHTPPRATLYDWLASIESRPTYADLASVCTLSPALQRQAIRAGPCLDAANGHNTTHNFDNLSDDPASDAPHTIEFRQHAGSLDYPDICAWVLTAVQLVLYSHTAGDVVTLALCARGIDRDFSLPDLLTTLGCHPDVLAHYTSSDRTLGLLRGRPVPPPHACDFAALDARNDAKSSLRSDSLARAFAAGDKAYGVSPFARAIEISVEGIAGLSQDACRGVAGACAGEGRGVVVSRARAEVLGVFAGVYREQLAGSIGACEELVEVGCEELVEIGGEE